MAQCQYHLYTLLVFPFVIASLFHSVSSDKPAGALSVAQDELFRQRRSTMVEEQIAERGIRDPLVLEAMRRVERHRFVPERYIGDAYEDSPLPIGYGQTISQPYIVALMTELLNLDRSDRVLEVGTGSGYQAAVLGEILDSVFTVEIIEELARSTADLLADLEYGNVHVLHADGYNGWIDHAPFDAIIVTAAAEHIPPPLIQQLKEGGRMVIPVGHPFFVQNLVLVEKQSGEVKTRNIAPVRFVPLTRMK